MSREELLKISRELTESFINDKNGPLRTEHYFMLSMAKFIMSKERMIKTDSKNRTLYFDDTEENSLSVDSFYEQIKDSYTFTMNGSIIPEEVFDSVILEHNSNPGLKKKIFIIGKIRDSLAHGKYDFDIANNRIIIRNKYIVGNNEFDFECSIKPETLAKFSENTNHETFNTTLKNLGNEKDYTYKLDDETEEFLNEYSKIYSQKGKKNYIKKIYYELDSLNSKFEEVKDYCSEDEITTYNNLYRTALTSLSELAAKTKTLDINRTRVKIKTLSNKTSIHEDDSLLDKVVDSLLSIAALIDRKIERNVVNTALVYNHLCLLLSENNTLEYRYLRNPSLQIFFKKKNENGKENDVTGALGILKKEIKIFNRKYQKISNYPETPSKLEAMKKIYLDLYNGIMIAFEIRNKSIYSRIRNGVMHSSIEMSKGKVVIKDSAEHSMDDPTFCCKASNEELLEYTRSIEEGNNKENYTLGTFISELYITLSSYGIDLNQFRNFFQNLTDCLKYIDSNIRLDINAEELKDKIEGNKEDSQTQEEDLDDKPPGM